MSDELPVYTVTVDREDNLWVAVVRDLPGGATDVARFDDLHDAVYDLIATLTDTETSEFWVEWEFLQGSPRLFDMLRDLRQWEKQAEVAAESRDAARRALADAMRDTGLSYREIADVIGMSHQRVGQILEKKDRAADVDFEAGGHVYEVKSWRYNQSSLRKWLTTFNPDLDNLGDDSYLRPFEATIVMVLQLALYTSPPARHNLLTKAAAVLEGAAEDDDFLRQADISQPSRELFNTR
jgi:transcriptional regulator with XRE-family HTH domain